MYPFTHITYINGINIMLRAIPLIAIVPRTYNTFDSNRPAHIQYIHKIVAHDHKGCGGGNKRNVFMRKCIVKLSH